jgi:glycine hydroxymethyltransferase
MCYMAHFSGFVVTWLLKNPFKWCDVVTSTTHKTLRGPRSGMIFCKKGLEQRINEAVFPGLQGGPHIHQIAGLAHQLLEVQGEDFYRYMCQVRANASQLATELGKLGHYVVGGGTENHMLLMNVKDIGLNGWKAEKALEVANISVNKNTIYGDKSALNPSGIRIGTPCVTTRGLKREDMAWVAETIDKVLRIAVRYADLEKSVFCSQIENCDEILKIRDEVKIKMNGLPFYS